MLHSRFSRTAASLLLSSLMAPANLLAEQAPQTSPAAAPQMETKAVEHKPVPKLPETIEVQTQVEGRMVPIGGSVVPYREVTLTAQFPGRVEFIAGEEGMQFPAEAVLVRLDVDEMLAQRRAAEAEVSNAEAGIRNAKVQYDRERQYPQRDRQGGMFPFMNKMPFMNETTDTERRADLHDFGTRIQAAEARLYQARSRLEEIDAKIDDAKGMAPFQGVVLEKAVNVGDTVQPGQPLINFGDLRYLQVQVDVPARLSVGLKPGAILKARLDDTDKSIVPVQVAQVFPKADPIRHTIRVKLHLPEGTLAAAGMYAEVLIPEQNARSAGESPVLPISAILERSGLYYAYVLTPDERVQMRLLRLGERTAKSAVVLTGVRVGEKVLADPRTATRYR